MICAMNEMFNGVSCLKIVTAEEGEARGFLESFFEFDSSDMVLRIFLE